MGTGTTGRQFLIEITAPLSPALVENLCKTAGRIIDAARCGHGVPYAAGVLSADGRWLLLTLDLLSGSGTPTPPPAEAPPAQDSSHDDIVQAVADIAEICRATSAAISHRLAEVTREWQYRCLTNATPNSRSQQSMSSTASPSG